jgi:hypothetical protein
MQAAEGKSSTPLIALRSLTLGHKEGSFSLPNGPISWANIMSLVQTLAGFVRSFPGVKLPTLPQGTGSPEHFLKQRVVPFQRDECAVEQASRSKLAPLQTSCSR